MEEKSTFTSAKRCGEQSLSTSTKRYKKSTSRVWEYFDKLNIGGKFKARCKECGQIYAGEHGTSVLHKHLKLNHGHMLLDEESGRVPDLLQHVTLGDGQQDSLPSPAEKELFIDQFGVDQDRYRELIVRAVIRHNYPYNFVEHGGTREVHTYLNPKLQHISQQMVKDDVLGIYRQEKEIFALALESIPVSLTFDLWFSEKEDGYLLLRANFVDENWTLQSRVLNLKFIPPPHEGPLLAEKVIDLLEEWGIKKKLFTITLNDASTNNGLVDVVKNHFNLLREGEYFHIFCGAQILDSTAQIVLKLIENCVIKIRQNVKYVKGTKERLLIFAKCVAQLSLESNKKFREDAPSKWTSTYLMLESMLQYKLAFRQLQKVDTNFNDHVTEEEWRKTEKVCKFLKPFHDISTLFSKKEYPTSNLYFSGIWKIQSLINVEVQDRNSILYDVAIEMNTKFKKYLDCYSLIFSFAIILDPRYKLEFVEFVFRKVHPTNYGEKLMYVRDKLGELYEEYSHLSACSDTSVPSSRTFSCGVKEEDIDDMDDFELFLEQKRELNLGKSQLDSYLEERNVDRKMPFDVLSYWKANKSRYTVLSVMAREILTIPITAAAPETSFGSGEQTFNKYHSLITPENVEDIEALLCSQSWLYPSEATRHEEQDDHLVTDIESLVAASYLR